MAVTPETALQIDILKLSKEIIEAPFRLRAFDRSRDHSGRQHLNESQRGIRTGTPDLELIHNGRSINIELKAGKNDTSDRQDQEMDLLRRAGAYCGVAWSCREVVAHWRAAGVPLSSNADLIALNRDLRREGRAAKRSVVLAPRTHRFRSPMRRSA